MNTNGVLFFKDQESGITVTKKESVEEENTSKYLLFYQEEYIGWAIIYNRILEAYYIFPEFRSLGHGTRFLEILNANKLVYKMAIDSQNIASMHVAIKNNFMVYGTVEHKGRILVKLKRTSISERISLEGIFDGLEKVGEYFV
ncbi:MAG: hypothetical protein ACRCX2_13635 [Paraclostridium sp.]